jgi:uncharacterized protein (DUF2062 family)
MLALRFTLWNLLTAICVLCPVFVALSMAEHANVSLGVFALVIAADLVLGAFWAATMYQGSNIVGHYYDRFTSQRFRRLWDGALLCAAICWIVCSIVVGEFVARALIRLNG